jgi:hypothetical protein
MSFNRLIYDGCAYKKEVKENLSHLDYNLYKGKFETATCKKADYTHNLAFGTRTNTESELYGLTRPLTNCPEKKYSPCSDFKSPVFTPSRVCEGIHYITPTGLEKPSCHRESFDSKLNLKK